MRPQKVQPTRQCGCRPSFAIRAVLSIGLLLCIAIVGLGTGAAQAQGDSAAARIRRGLQDHKAQTKSRQHSDARPGQNRQSYYGILGPVGRPGVYVTADARLSLVRLVQAARGLTDDASPLATVVRNGRSGPQFRYSGALAERLTPGDVVVFVPTERRNGTALTEAVPVAFVGLEELRPIIASITPDAATLPQILSDLHQPPALLSTICVIRSDRAAAAAGAGQHPHRLVPDDVIVFDPATIDRPALLQTQPYPPAYPIDSDAREHVMTIEPAGRPADVQLVGASVVADSSPTVRDLEIPEPTLPTGDVVQAVAPSREGIDHGASATTLPYAISLCLTEERADSTTPGVKAEAFPLARSPLVVPTSLQLEPVLEIQPAASEQSASLTDPQPSLERPVPAPAEPGIDFTADSGLRLPPAAEAFEEPAPEEFHAVAEARRQNVARLATVPTPRDLTEESPASSFIARATTLGLAVLTIALGCILASLLWSRLDRKAGLRQGRSVQREVHAATAADAEPRALDRLIANSLPLIEEQTSLPDRVFYHGEAIGRRRLRIDARHVLQGPHPHKTSDRQPQREVAAVATAQSGDAKHFRIDASLESPPASVVERSRSASEGRRTVGLLERVLVAMEREKRR